MSEVLLKEELFRDLGYGGGHDLLEAAIEKAGLSRPDKTGIAAGKTTAVQRVLAAEFLAVCSRGDCQGQAERVRGTRATVPAATPADCDICGGSSNARAVDRLVKVFGRAGLSRLCVVGGSPNSRTELQSLVDGRLELRLVDGTTARTTAQAKTDLSWADVVAVWGGTQLDHKVSDLYQGPHVIGLARRSIRDLAMEVVAAVEQHGEDGRRGFRL